MDDEYFEQIFDTIHPDELQLYKTNTSDIEALFPDLNLLNLSISNDINCTKIIWEKTGRL